MTMFTLEQIQSAHAKVKSGADFPQYIRELIVLGVASYDTFVIDGHALFKANDGQTVISLSKYPEIRISDIADAEAFGKHLKSHQNGDTDYLVFCGHAAETGVWKWTVDTAEMTCTYFDSNENRMLREQIPS